MNQLTDIPTIGEYDVVVCGAGPAGIGAAIAAAREGASTLLVEQLYHVGGMGTATPVNTWCDTHGGTIFDELEERVGLLGQASRRFSPQGHTYPKGRVNLRGATVAVVALRMLKEAGVEIMFGATAARPLVEDNRVHGVFVANRAGVFLVKAHTVVDCTADAMVAAGAGVECLMGDPEDGRIMHVNFMFAIGGVDAEKYEANKPDDGTLVEMIRAAHAEGRLHAPKGVFRPAPEVFPYHPPEQVLVTQSWEIEKVDCSDPDAVTDTLIDCQLRALEVVEFLREHLPGHEECFISRLWEILGTRESQRIVGKYTVTREDVLAGAKFDDGIAQAVFFIDFHDSPPGTSIPYTLEYKQKNIPPPGEWYEIPYRCLIPESVRGLLVAGRCISCDRSALASLRVMPTCMFLGQAAGTAAAMAVQQGTMVDDVDGAEVKRALGGDGWSYL